jgi:hypothetical protein
MTDILELKQTLNLLKIKTIDVSDTSFEIDVESYRQANLTQGEIDRLDVFMKNKNIENVSGLYHGNIAKCLIYHKPTE